MLSNNVHHYSTVPLVTEINVKNMVFWPKMAHFGHYLLKASSGARFPLPVVWPCKELSKEVYHYSIVALVTEINVKYLVFRAKNDTFWLIQT